ncbi:MAG: alpha-amylase [Candidatus Izimaplasma sp.]|nr:alpha-amylase [Candidatus Izimaplasma bacterium]
MKTLKLQKIKKILKQKKGNMIYNYAIPDVWNCFDYSPDKFIRLESNELLVDPYDFYLSVIDDVIIPMVKKEKDYHNSVHKSGEKSLPSYLSGGDWIKQSVVYSTMVRTSAAWDNDRTQTLDQDNIYHMKETGSFLKLLALLPLLKKMDVDVVYMLPISEYSRKDKKGDLGSPYGVKNFTKIDHELKDSLLGEDTTVEEEFMAFVEACHILNMKVMIDIIPRTNSVNSELVKEHPEWFYWIKSDQLKHYKAPRVEGLGNTLVPTTKLMKTVYNTDDTYRHINMFEYDPKTQNKTLWNKIKDNDNLHKEIEKHFNLKVAPAFSDQINDPQPPWSDVTFFRMYNDLPIKTREFVDTTDRPPYILFDTIKSNMFKGQKPNEALWKTLTDIIPSFQRRFGIDGARIDMGHALPRELINRIMKKARKLDPDFCFIAEELQPSEAKNAKEAGYNLIIGNGFMLEPRVFEGKLYEFVYNATDLVIPQFALGESHDTPRLAARDGGENLSRVLTILNMFIPNSIPFINSAQEVYEKQPMNTGLDARENEKFMLDIHDPYYGKLALFDSYQFHYTNNRRWELPDILDYLKPIRQEFKTQLTNKRYFVPLKGDHSPKTFIGIGYFKNTKRNQENMLLVFANSNTYNEVHTTVNISTLRKKANNKHMIGQLLFSTHEGPREFSQFYDLNNLDIHLGAGEVKIIKI